MATVPIRDGGELPLTLPCALLAHAAAALYAFRPCLSGGGEPPYWLSYQETHLQNSSIPYLIGYPFTPNSGSELWGSGAKPTRNPQRPEFGALSLSRQSPRRRLVPGRTPLPSLLHWRRPSLYSAREPGGKWVLRPSAHPEQCKEGPCKQPGATWNHPAALETVPPAPRPTCADRLNVFSLNQLTFFFILLHIRS